ncbi:hypothetical protein I552_2637 [Mycobacterium xenopi 3993]|nr:hypothetical protein I552_2637 [Mycobacterium xenopi 3993]
MQEHQLLAHGRAGHGCTVDQFELQIRRGDKQFGDLGRVRLFAWHRFGVVRPIADDVVGQKIKPAGQGRAAQYAAHISALNVGSLSRSSCGVGRTECRSWLPPGVGAPPGCGRTITSQDIAATHRCDYGFFP